MDDFQLTMQMSDVYGHMSKLFTSLWPVLVPVLAISLVSAVVVLITKAVKRFRGDD